MWGWNYVSDKTEQPIIFVPTLLCNMTYPHCAMLAWQFLSAHTVSWLDNNNQNNLPKWHLFLWLYLRRCYHGRIFNVTCTFLKEPFYFQELERRSSLGGQPSQTASPNTPPPHSTASQHTPGAGQTSNSQNSDGKHFLGERREFFSVLNQEYLPNC